MTDTVSPGPQRKDPSIRKNNKPLMEKKRRARINDCLGQLKSLVLQALKKDSSQFSKLEKADILELTVKHLRNLQRQQRSAAMATDPAVMEKYRAGFNECANEVMHYVGSCHALSNDVKGNLVNHLANCLQTVNTPPSHPEPVQRCLQPLHVQIPPNSSSLVQTATTTTHVIPTSMQATPISQTVTPTSTVSSETSPFQGAFHILPSSLNGNPVAVYLGSQNTGTMTSAVPVYSIQVPHTNGLVSSFMPSPVDSDKSGFSSDLESPVTERRFSDSMMFASPSPVSSSPVSASSKEERVWRPW
ncbi:transcription factor HES-4-A-like [Gigantopelta aegis]|uniref:transcription factor HES-4-A-like n=1 Tax=Gigantopelta aegis TaxID=1735272 RepID=UPI001B88C57C|nr:transcription factor HES-4-A-like [Gigantopelta aegis]